MSTRQDKQPIPDEWQPAMEIARLRDRVRLLEDALDPFVQLPLEQGKEDNDILAMWVTAGQIRAANALLSVRG